MLENEPEGGEQPDVRPLDATPESTEAAPGPPCPCHPPA